MKLLKEMKEQSQSGVRKSLNWELWHACAGPLVSLPQVGSLAYYFPQGHSEQVSVVPADESKIILKGRLGPGMMITVDLPGGQVCTAIFSCFAWCTFEHRHIFF